MRFPQAPGSSIGGDGIAGRGPAYGIPAFRVDGNDILAVYQVTQMARKMALASSTPILIEAITYRLGHHSTSDDSLAYRSKEEIEAWNNPAVNPIERFKKYLEAREIWNKEKDKTFKEQIRKEILVELVNAEKQPKPAIDEMFTDVFDEMTENLREQRDELRALMKEYPEAYPTGRQHVESAADNIISKNNTR